MTKPKSAIEPPIDVEAVRRMSVEGSLGPKAIAKALGCSTQRVSALQHKMGLASVRRRRADERLAATVARNAKIVALSGRGVSVASIAKAVGVSPSTVIDVMREAEVAARREAEAMRLADLSAALLARPLRPAALVPTRVIGPGYGGTPDVEHADAALAAAEAAPFRGGRYPKAPRSLGRSGVGSSAASCAES